MDEPNKEQIKIATSSEERVSGMLLDALETFNQFMSVAQGLEDYDNSSLLTRGGNETYIITNRRCEALTKSANALKGVVRIAKPTLSQVVDISKEGNDIEELDAIKYYLNQILSQIDMAERTPTKQDDLVSIKEVGNELGYNYSVKEYRLTRNFWNLVKQLEDLYDGTYSIILKNGLITPKIKPNQIRSKTNEL